MSVTVNSGIWNRAEMVQRNYYETKAYRESQKRKQEQRKNPSYTGIKRIEGPRSDLVVVVANYSVIYSQAREEWVCISDRTKEVVASSSDRAAVVEAYQALAQAEIIKINATYQTRSQRSSGK